MRITACGWWLCVYLLCASASTAPAAPNLDPGGTKFLSA